MRQYFIVFVFHCTVSCGLGSLFFLLLFVFLFVFVFIFIQLWSSCHSGKFILVVYKMNDPRPIPLSPLTSKKSQIHFTSDCFEHLHGRCTSVYF